MTWQAVQRFLGGTIKGFGLLARDLHRFLHGRFGDRVYAAYVIVGLLFLLVVTGAIWALIEALITLLILGIIIVFAARLLLSSVSGGRRRR